MSIYNWIIGNNNRADHQTINNYGAPADRTTTTSVNHDADTTITTTTITTNTTQTHGTTRASSRSNLSPLQDEWLRRHPVYNSVQRNSDIKSLIRSLTHASALMHNPGWLMPSSMPSLHSAQPKLIDYVQLPVYLWIPEYTFPHLVPAMPCANCNGFGTRQRWNASNGVVP